MSQAGYSARSKGEYGPCKTIDIDCNGSAIRGGWRGGAWTLSGEPIARVRIYTAGGELYGPDSIVHISDKPAKALPLDLDALETAANAAIVEKELAA